MQHSWDPGQECQIAAAILDLFYLLPPPAVKFLETQARGYLPHLAQIPSITSRFTVPGGV